MYGIFPLAIGEMRAPHKGGYALALCSASGTVEINTVSGAVANGRF
jgi:hypothetical protein